MRAIFFGLVILDVLAREHGGIADDWRDAKDYKLGSKSHKRGSEKHKKVSGSASHKDFLLESVKHKGKLGKHKGKTGKHKGDSGSDYKDSDRSLK